MGKKTLVIIQARMGSTRLPGKVFEKILDQPMLWHVINRVRHCQMIHEIVIAIPDTAANDELELFVNRLNVRCFRGSEEDVLSRYYGAAKANQGEIIVRLTSDCPLIDPQITDSAIRLHIKSGVDYTSRGPNGGLPRGFDTEVFNFPILERAYLEAKAKHEREHVTPYIYQHPDLFRTHRIKTRGKLKRPEFRLTVDTPEDLYLIREIYQRLFRGNRIFHAEDIIELLDKSPELIAINAHIKQKELEKG